VKITLKASELLSPFRAFTARSAHLAALGRLPRPRHPRQVEAEYLVRAVCVGLDGWFPAGSAPSVHTIQQSAILASQASVAESRCADYTMAALRVLHCLLYSCTMYMNLHCLPNVM
jgi:hypothetical protein